MKNIFLVAAMSFVSMTAFAAEKEIEINGRDAKKIMEILRKAGAFEEQAMGGRYGFSAKEVFCHGNRNDRSIKNCKLTIQSEE